jgi:hypothetical protein
MGKLYLCKNIQQNRQKKQNQYPNLLINPADSIYFPPKDERNRPIDIPDNENCKKVILRIVRHRLASGEECLTSFSQIIGYDYYGNKKTFTCDSPERWTKPIFSVIKEFNTKKKQIVAYSNGPTGSEEVFDMPFTPQNVDKLYAETYDGNSYFKPSSRSNQRVTLYIKDHQQNAEMVKEVFWSSIEESLRIFKEKDFNHLWNQLYLPQAIRETLAMNRLGVVDSDKSNNSSTSTRAGPTVNNNSAYK